MGELGLAAAIAVAFDPNDLGMVREAVDQGDGAGRVGKDRVPRLEGQVGGHDDRLLLVATTDDLKEEIGGVRIVGQVPDLEREELRAHVGAESGFEGARSVLAVEIEHEIGRGEKERGVAREGGLVDEVFGEHRFTEALCADQNDVLAFREEVECEDALEGRAMELLGPRPVADREKPNMGLNSWNSGVVRKGDVTVAKNYLGEDEIAELNRVVVMWLDFAEDQARRRKRVFLKDWDTKLDEFLRFNERAVLRGKGTVSKADADARAEGEYDAFMERRRALLEAEAERAQQKALEAAAKRLPARTPKPDGGRRRRS